MKKIIALFLALIVSLTLCACGTTEKQVIKEENHDKGTSSESTTTYTEKWLLMKETHNYGMGENVITYTYDDFGKVSEVFETDSSDGTWYKIIIKDNKIAYIESNFNEVYAIGYANEKYAEEYELIISLEGDYEYTLQMFCNDVCIRKVTNTLNDSGHIVKAVVIQYNQGYRIESIRSFDKNNAITAMTYTKFDLDTNEVLDQSIDTYYCTYDSNQLPIAAYDSDEYESDSPEPYVEYVWDLVEVKK